MTPKLLSANEIKEIEAIIDSRGLNESASAVVERLLAAFPNLAALQAPVTDEEVAELLIWLEGTADAIEFEGGPTAASYLKRALALIRRQALALADTKADYLRRHKDACDRYEEVLALQSTITQLTQELEQARATAQKLFAEHVPMIAERDAARMALTEARDLLLERTHGSPARSAAHNARLVIDAALQSEARAQTEGEKG